MSSSGFNTASAGTAFGTGSQGFQSAWDTYVGNTSVKSLTGTRIQGVKNNSASGSSFGTGDQGFKNAWDYYVTKSNMRTSVSSPKE